MKAFFLIKRWRFSQILFGVNDATRAIDGDVGILRSEQTGEIGGRWAGLRFPIDTIQTGHDRAA